MNILPNRLQHFLFCLLLSLPFSLSAAPSAELPSVELTPAEEAEVQKLVLPIPENWIGDFEGMRERCRHPGDTGHRPW